MKLRTICLVLTACLLAATGWPAMATETQRVIVFGTGHRTIPKGSPVVALDNEAYSQDLIEIVADTAGLKYRIVEKDTWPELLAAFTSGEIDSIPTVARIPEREKIMLFSVPHVRGTLVAVTRSDEPAPAVDIDLNGKRISVIANTLSYFYLQKRGWLDHAVLVASDRLALDAVAEGRADATIINEFTGIALINKFGLKNQLVIALTLPDSVTDFCMVVRPGEEALLGQLNDGLFLAEQRGEVRRNYEKWFRSSESSAGQQARSVRWLMLGGAAVVLIFVVSWSWARYSLRLARRRTDEIARLVQSRTHELAEANLQLSYSEEKFSKAFLASPDAIMITQIDDGTILEVNEGFTRIFGFGRAEIVGRTAVDVGLWSQPADRAEMMRLIRAEGQVRNHAGPFRRKDGELRSGSTSVEPIKIGNVNCLVAIIRDVTESERAQAALRESEARFRTLVESAPEAIIVFDPDSRRLTDANENALRMFETTREELLATNFDRLAPDRQPDGRTSVEAVAEMLHRTLAGGSPAAEWLVRSRSGRSIPVELRFVLLPGGGRNLVRGSLTDITERKRLEEQLRHAQRMESIGRLAGGVAHDFNNILTVIQLNTSLLLAEEQLPESQRDAIQQISQSTTFAAGLTRQLLVFSRKEVIQRTSLDVALVIKETSRLLRRVIGEDILLEVQNAPGLPPIFADQGMVEQVLLNLAVNSRDAMPRGGRLGIKTGVVEPDEAYRQRVPQALAGRFVCIATSDTGHGIAPDILPRIFEPFFTTKEVGKGTGLGLATVYGIVEQHQGWVEVDSTVGQGTEFRVYLPCLDQSASTAPVAAAGSGRDRGSETILVVEDDALVRASSCLILQRNGYRVFEASSPQAALELWAAHREQIQLVFTDVIMPGGMTGRELVEQLRRDRTELKVLFTSGYTAELLQRDFVRTSLNFFLQKPFGADELIRSVRECLRPG